METPWEAWRNMGEDDKLQELQRKLVLLVSIYRDEVGGVPVAESLYAVANGVIGLEGDRGRWISEEGVVEIPFSEPSELEANLEGFLSQHVVCFQVDGDVPMLTSLRVRIKAGSQMVELDGRAVQRTVAGVVFQLEKADVHTQRALVSLPGVLRSTPTQPLKVDRGSVHFPELLPVEDARLELYGAPPVAPAPAAEPSRDEFARDDQTVLDASPVHQFDSGASAPLPAEPELPEIESGLHEATDAEDRARVARLRFRRPKVEAVEARLGKRSHFDFLSIHFSADGAEVKEARDALLVLIRQCREDDHKGELASSLDRIVARVNEAWAALESPGARRKHRSMVVERYQIETAIETYGGQAESAKLTRRIEIAVDCYRRLIELDPSDVDARSQMEALQHIVE